MIVLLFESASPPSALIAIVGAAILVASFAGLVVLIRMGK